MTLPFRRIAEVTLLALALSGPIAAQTGPPVISHPYGRATVEVALSHARPGGVFGVGVRNARWATANTLLDGRRGAMTNETGRLFGIIPVALDTSPGEHKLSVFFPGGRGRGGATSLSLPVTSIARPGRARSLSPAAIVSVSSQAALGHGRFLLGAIRTREVKAYHSGPLYPPLPQPVSFPFGGPEDFGRVMGPVKDGLMGEQHRGVDYETALGTPVSAPGAGIVLLARSLLFSGETVVIGHGRGLISVLSHLSYVNVREGEVVAQGTTLGTSGMTGIGALSPHVCFSVYLHSVNVDPEALMDASLWPALAGK